MSQGWDSNPLPAVYDTAALPAELPWRSPYFSLSREGQFDTGE